MAPLNGFAQASTEKQHAHERSRWKQPQPRELRPGGVEPQIQPDRKAVIHGADGPAPQHRRERRQGLGQSARSQESHSELSRRFSRRSGAGRAGSRRW